MSNRPARVVPPDLHRGSLLVAITIGALAGSLVPLWDTLLEAAGWRHRFNPLVSLYLYNGLLTLPILWTVLLSLMTPRRRSVLLAGIGSFIAYAMVGLIASQAATIFQWKQVLFLALLSIGATVLAALGGVVFSIVIWWCVSMAGQRLPQNGALCWRCAYDLSGSPAGAVCPECGKDPASALPRWRLIVSIMQLLTRRAVPLLAITAVILISVAAWWVGVWSIPAHRFAFAPALSSVMPPAKEYLAHHHGGYRGGGGFTPCISLSLAVQDHPDRVVKVIYNPRPAPGLAAMIIELAAMKTLSAGAVNIPWAEPLQPSIKAYLSREQAQAIIEGGVPQELVDQLLAEAAAAKAVPMRQVAFTAVGGHPIVVDASRFLPGLPPYTGPTLGY